MKYLFVATIVMFTLACDTDSLAVFRQHVSPTSTYTPAHIDFHKVRSAMHGPLLFRFDIRPEFVDELVKQHSLTEVTVLPTAASQLSDPMSKDVPWWKPSTAFGPLKKYIVQYNPKSGFGDWQTRMLVIDGTQAYFLTTGHFDMSQYELAPAEGTT